ncbi:MAG: hypothetical protein RIT46_1322 [Pseudomonadota bacterium]|jgi:hypothetical protein
MQRAVEIPPSPNPLPLKGGKGYVFYRVIASEAKQPRGLTRTSSDIPLGCFGAMRLAMTRGSIFTVPPIAPWRRKS